MRSYQTQQALDDACLHCLVQTDWRDVRCFTVAVSPGMQRFIKSRRNHHQRPGCGEQVCDKCGHERRHFNEDEKNCRAHIAYGELCFCPCTFPAPEGDDSEAVRGLQPGKSYGIAIDLDDYQSTRRWLMQQPKGTEETADILITYRDQRVTMSFEDFARIVGIEFEPDTQDQSRN